MIFYDNFICNKVLNTQSQGIMTESKAQAPNAILFDWDSTLVNPSKEPYEVLNHIMDLFKVKKQYEGRMKYMATRETFPIIFGNKWPDARKLFYQKLNSHTQKPSTIEGAEELIQYINSKNIYTAIVSNKNIELLNSEINTLSWQGLFYKIIGSGSTPYDKPSPEPLFEGLKNSGIKAGKNVWFVGDSIIDLECATNANCTRVLYEYEKIKQNSIIPEIKINKLLELKIYIDQFIDQQK